MILAFSAFFSFVIATFINEIQGSGNAIKKLGLNQDQVCCLTSINHPYLMF